MDAPPAGRAAAVRRRAPKAKGSAEGPEKLKRQVRVAGTRAAPPRRGVAPHPRALAAVVAEATHDILEPYLTAIGRP